MGKSKEVEWYQKVGLLFNVAGFLTMIVGAVIFTYEVVQVGEVNLWYLKMGQNLLITGFPVGMIGWVLAYGTEGTDK